MEMKRIGPNDVALFSGSNVAAIFHSLMHAADFARANGIALTDDQPADGTRYCHAPVPTWDAAAVASGQPQGDAPQLAAPKAPAKPLTPPKGRKGRL